MLNARTVCLYNSPIGNALFSLVCMLLVIPVYRIGGALGLFNTRLFLLLLILPLVASISFARRAIRYGASPFFVRVRLHRTGGSRHLRRYVESHVSIWPSLKNLMRARGWLIVILTYIAFQAFAFSLGRAQVPMIGRWVGFALLCPASALLLLFGHSMPDIAGTWKEWLAGLVFFGINALAWLKAANKLISMYPFMKSLLGPSDSEPVSLFREKWPVG
jgi:hypothetical protein